MNGAQFGKTDKNHSMYREIDILSIVAGFVACALTDTDTFDRIKRIAGFVLLAGMFGMALGLVLVIDVDVIHFGMLLLVIFVITLIVNKKMIRKLDSVVRGRKI